MVGSRPRSGELGVGKGECSRRVRSEGAGLGAIALSVLSPSGPPAQGSGHSAAELAGKHSRSAAHLKCILPRDTDSWPATLIVSAVRSYMCVRTEASPARGLTPTRSTAPCTTLLETGNPVSNP